uniref:Uncharacterized protein n=2 Tax=Meloidogyne enterolobii TaxID=390850 RepID=A0A6V7TXN0_MELEN|nr:unnamed protein product [Meloidogyne enterolobii]
MKIVVKSEVQEEMTSTFDQNEQMNDVSSALTTFGSNDLLMNNPTIVRSGLVPGFFVRGIHYNNNNTFDWEFLSAISMRRPVLPNNENVGAVLQPVENQGRHRPDAPTKILSDTVNQLRQDLTFSRAQYNELFQLHQQHMAESREQSAANREALRASRADAAENREALRASRADAAEIREALRAALADAAENREALRASREALHAAQNQIEQLQNLLRQNNILPPNNLNNGILQNGDPMNLDVYLGNEGVRNDVNYNEFVVQQPNNRNQRRNLNQIQNENILPGFQNIGQLPNMPQNNVNQVGEARNNNDFLRGGQQQNNPNNANRPMYNGQYGNHRAGNFPNQNGWKHKGILIAKNPPNVKDENF